jgi:hypothetical protein
MLEGTVTSVVTTGDFTREQRAKSNPIAANSSNKRMITTGRERGDMTNGALADDRYRLIVGCSQV